MSWGYDASYAAERRLLTSACGFLLCVLVAGAASASPQGGAVVGGQGSIHRPDAHHTVIDQRSSSLAIDWRSFNLSHDDVVRFRQPSSSAAALNRILDQNPSTILGTIDANGRVFLINPNGLIFGRGARVNVGSLVAGTLDIAPDDFMRGEYHFQAPAGTTPGVVINRGLIEAATGGSVTLMGGAVANQGLILARYGHVNLGAGRAATLDFNGDGLLRFRVDEGVLDNAKGLSAAVSNSGTIDADGGQVLLTGRQSREVFSQVVNNSGVIRAGRIQRQGGDIRLVAGPAGSVVNTGTVDASARSASDQGGTIVVSAGAITQSGAIHADGASGGSVSLSGVDTVTLDGDGVTSARGTTGEGGSVRVLGDAVTLADRAAVDVSGGAGGGTVLVGGDFHGAGPTPAATTTSVAAGARVRADALSAGDGGRVAIWSDDATRFSGRVSARGAGAAGVGGFVEVSGKRNLGFNGTVDVGAARGRSGTLLLDPRDVIVAEGTSGSGSSDSDACPSNVCNVEQGDGGTTADYTISNGALQTSTANIVLQATRDFIQNAPIDLSGASHAGQSLTVQAGRNIEINAALTTNAGAIHLEADSPEIAGDGTGALELAKNVPVRSQGGTITLIGADFDFGSGSSIDAGGGPINVARSGTTLSGTFSIGMNSDALSATDFGQLKTRTPQGINGTITIGQADTAGSDGAGTNAQEITNSLSIDEPLTLGQGSLVFAGQVTSLADDISTNGGAVTFLKAVTLDSDVTVDTTNANAANTGAIAFDGAITGAGKSLTLNAGAGAVELAAVGDASAVSGLTVTTTGTTTLNGDINSSGAVDLSAAGGGIALGSNVIVTAADDISMGSAVSGAGKTLKLNASTGALSLAQVGSTTSALDDLSLSGGALSLGGAVYAGSLSLNGTSLALGGDLHVGSALDFTSAGPITLENDVTVDTAAANGAQNFGTAAIDGTHTLSLKAGGGAITLGSVGATTAVSSLAVTTTGTATLGGDIASTGAVDLSGATGAIQLDAGTIQAGGAVGFGGAVTLGADSKITAQGITFGHDVSGGFGLTLDGGNGSVGLGTVGAGGVLKSLDVSGGATLNGDILTDGGAVSFGGPVTLGIATVVDTTNGGTATSAGDITFSKAVTGAGKSLTLKAGSGAVSLAGAGASGEALAGLDLSGGVLSLSNDVYADALSLAGTALHLGGDLHVGSALDFTKAGPITLNADVTVDTKVANGTQDFGGTTIDGTHILKLDAGGGTITLGSVGATTAVSGLTVATTGTTTLNDDIHSSGAVDLSGATGAIQLNAASIQAGAAVSFGGPVRLDTAAVVDTTNGGTATSPGDITFSKAVAGAGKSLTLKAGSGAVSLAGVGTSGAALTGLDLSGGALSLGGAVYADSLSLSGTSLALGGDLHVGSALDFTQAGPITLNTDVTVDTKAANGTQDFSGTTIDGTHILKLDAGGGAVTLGSVGGTKKLSSLTVAATGTTTLGGDIASTGAVDLSGATGAIQLDAGTIQAGGAVSFGGAVTLGADSKITAQGITFGQDVSGGFGLTLDGGSGSVGLATVGGGGVLKSLDVSGGATLNGDILTDGGAVSFGGPVTLGIATVVDTTNGGTATSAGDITFSKAVTGAGKSLTLKAGSGAVSLAGAGASGEALAGLDLSGGVLSLSNDVYADALSFAGTALHLGGDLHVGSALDFTGAGPITLDSDVAVDTAAANGAQNFGTAAIDGTHTLTLKAGGGAITLGSVGATTAVSGLAVTTTGTTTLNGDIHSSGAVDLSGATGAIQLNAGSIQAGAAVSFGGAVALGADSTSIAAQGITYDGDVSGTHALILNGGSGGVSLSSVGSTAAVNGLTVVTTGNTALNGDITSSGNLDLTNATGPIALHGGHVHAGGTALFGGAVTLAGDTIIDGSTIHFAGDVSGGHALTLNGGSGDISLSSVGAGDALSSLTVNAGNGVHLGGDVHAVNGIRFTEPLILDNTVTITGGAIDFANAIDAAVTDQQGLTLNGGSGGVTIDGSVGAKQRLAFLRVNGPGANTFNGDIATAGALDLSSASGTTTLNLAQITAGGPVQFDGPVVLGQDLAVTASDAAVELGGPITAGGGHKLSLDAGGGALSLHAAGTASDPLGHLTLVGGSLVLAGDIFTRGGLDFSDVGAVEIAAPVALDTSVDGGDLSFDTTPLEGPGALTLRTGGGDVALAAVGESQPLDALTVSGSGTNTLNGAVHVSGPIDVDGATRLNGGSIITDGAQIKLNGPLYLGADTSMRSNGGSLLLGDAPVTGANRRLSLDAGGGNVTLGPVGTVADPLAQFSVTGAGQLNLTGDLATRGAVDLSADDGVSQDGNIDSGGGDVRLETTNGDITMNAGTATRTHGGDIDYTADRGSVVLGQLDADTGNVVVNALGGDILSNGASPNVTATTASLSALGAIGEHDEPIHFAVPDNGRITLTLGAAAAYISNNSAAPVISDSPVVNVAGQILSGAEKGQVASLTDLGYVDWSAFSPDLRLFGITGSGVLLPPDQREE